MSMRKPVVAFALLLMMVLPLVFIATADGQPPQPSINAAWLEGENGLNQHAYLITFADNGSYDVDIDVTAWARTLCDAPPASNGAGD